jgi:hypothetical protein
MLTISQSAKIFGGAAAEGYWILDESSINSLMNGEALDDEGAIKKWLRLK